MDIQDAVTQFTQKEAENPHIQELRSRYGLSRILFSALSLLQ